jgi:hypothetical protein
MTEKITPAWIQALKEKSQPDLKKRLLYLEHMCEALTHLYHNETTNVDIWVDCVDKCPPGVDNYKTPETGFRALNMKFERGEIPDTFMEFIHNFCTTLCAEKLVVESLIVKQ